MILKSLYAAVGGPLESVGRGGSPHPVMIIRRSTLE